MLCLSGYIWIYLKLRKYCNFGTKNSRRAWHVFPAQEVNYIKFHDNYYSQSLYRVFDVTKNYFVKILFNPPRRFSRMHTRNAFTECFFPSAPIFTLIPLILSSNSVIVRAIYSKMFSRRYVANRSGRKILRVDSARARTIQSVGEADSGLSYPPGIYRPPHHFPR